MEKRDVYDVIEDAIWARYIWSIVIIGAAIIGATLAVLAIMFL